MLKPLEVKTENLATKSVTSEKIADKAIENRHIKEGSVTPDKLTITPVSRPISPPIDSAEIKDGAVKTDEIAGNAVTADKIAPNAITAEKIQDGAVTSQKIRDGAITKEKMADGIIGTAEIIDGSITAAKLASNSVTAAKIAANAVGSSEIAAGAVSTSELSTNAVTTEKIANAAVTPAKLSFSVPTRPLTPPVTTDEIGDGQVTQAKLAPGVGGGDTLTMLPVPATALDQGGIVATTAPATVDLSGIIPVNTKGVIVSIACINQSYVNGGMMAYIYQQAGAEYALQVMAPPVNAPGVSNGGAVLMPVATDRTLLWQAYVSGNNSTELVIYILGYVM